MIYLMPRTSGLPSEALSLLSAAKVVVREPDTLWEALNKIEADALNLIALDENNFSVLLRHVNTLLPELPTVVTNIPQVHYSSAFMMMASKIPAIDWSEFESKLAKTGLMATTKEMLDANVQHNQGLRMMSELSPATSTASAGPSSKHASLEEEMSDGLISFESGE